MYEKLEHHRNRFDEAFFNQTERGTKRKKHRDDDEDKKLKTGNEMIGRGVRGDSGDEESDSWGDLNPSDIFIEDDDDTIVRKIEGNLKYLKNGDIKINGKKYKSDNVIVEDDENVFIKCGSVLRCNGS